MSRASCDRVHDALVGQITATRSQYELAQAEIRRLTDLIVEMKREGYNPPATPPDYTEPSTDLPDEILEAIAARAPVKSELERSLYRWAKQAYTGTNAEAIAATIWHGGDTDEDT